MNSTMSVTAWLERLKTGEQDEPTRRLWEAYFAQLVRRAEVLLRGRTGPGDGEDVALSAFASFVEAVHEGRFPRLNDRADLWQVLLLLTARKATKYRNRELAERRGGGRVAALSTLAEEEGSPGQVDFPGEGPSPAEAAALADTYAQLMAALGKDDLRQVAVGRLEGRTNAEIAARLGRSEGTVERKAKAIREIWELLLAE